MSGRDERPKLVVRVGVTGTRKVEPQRLDALRLQIRAVLDLIRVEAETLGRDPQAKSTYRRGEAGEVAVELRILSPLAEGADRLVAAAALGLGYSVFTPLPFTPSDYETDFPDSVDDFRRLAAGAPSFVLDGDRTEAAASYEAVGRFVVRNCDVLVAVWNGGRGEGRGGTAEIVHFAARSDLPIWWIHPTGGEAPRFLARAGQWRKRHDAPSGDKAEAALRTYLKTMALPPKAPSPYRSGLIGRLVAFWHGPGRHQPSPLTIYLNEKPRGDSRGLWRSYAILYKVLAPKVKAPSPPAKPVAASGAAAPTAAEAWWDQHYRRADGLSLSYGDRYRSSYILIILLAFATVLASALLGPLLNSLAGPETGSVTATIIDFILLGLIGLLVWVNHSRDWHERWITYRLLAELCRKQVILAPLGRTLPGVEVNRTAMEAAAHHAITGADGHKVVVPPRESWVGWYFLALQRGAPLPQGDAAAAARRALQLARSLIHEQKLYHHDRRERAERADRNLADTGTWFFLLTLVGLGLRLFLAAEGVPLDKMAWIEILATFFSAASAGFVGLRAYTEFALLGRQSLYMGEVMEEFSNELDLIDLDLPLASRDLGGVLHRLAMAMMLEVRGWAQLFRLKSVETG